MAIHNVGIYPHKQIFYGKAIDVKPTNVYIGDKFTETDTLKEFLYDGTKWIDNVSLPMNYVHGIATVDGLFNSIVDDTKDFMTLMFDGKTVKIVMDGKEYYRPILATTGRIITIEPIMLATKATVSLSGSGEGNFTGGCVVSTVVEGVSGNDYSIQLVAGVGESLMTTISFENDVITITSGTNELGEPLYIYAGDIQSLINNTLVINELFESSVEIVAGAIEFTDEPVPFTDGSDGVIVKAGTPYIIMN